MEVTWAVLVISIYTDNDEGDNDKRTNLSLDRTWLSTKCYFIKFLLHTDHSPEQVVACNYFIKLMLK